MALSRYQRLASQELVPPQIAPPMQTCIACFLVVEKNVAIVCDLDVTVQMVTQQSSVAIGHARTFFGSYLDSAVRDPSAKLFGFPTLDSLSQTWVVCQAVSQPHQVQRENWDRNFGISVLLFPSVSRRVFSRHASLK